MSHCLLQLLHPPAILQCWSSAHWRVHAVWHINPHPPQPIAGTIVCMVPASLYSHCVPARACPWGFECCSLELWDRHRVHCWLPGLRCRPISWLEFRPHLLMCTTFLMTVPPVSAGKSWTAPARQLPLTRRRLSCVQHRPSSARRWPTGWLRRCVNAVFVILSAVCFGWLTVGIVPCPLMGRQNPSVLGNPYVF